MIGPRRAGGSLARGVVRSLVFWLVLAGLLWLDAAGPHAGQHAAVFQFILIALGYVADALGWIGGVIATTVEAAVVYLGSVLAWLTRRVASILFSTGAIFSRVWNGIRIFWSNIVRPMLVWVDSALRRVETWLRRTFEPLFRFLRAIRTQLEAIYRRYLEPVLDTIEFIKRFNRILNTFHIHVLDRFTEVLTRIEDRIEEPFLWIYSKLADLTDWINRIVTADGLFQRLTLLRSMDRDLLYSWRMLVNGRSGALTDAERIALRDKTRLPSLSVITTRLLIVLRAGDFRVDPDVAALSDELLAWEPPPESRR